MSSKKQKTETEEGKELSAFAKKLRAARGQMNSENATYEKVVAEIDRLADTAATLLMKSYPFQIHSKLDMDVAVVAQEIADGFDTLINESGSQTFHLSLEMKELVKVKGFSFESLVGSIFSSIVLNCEDEIKAARSSGTERSINSASIAQITLIRKEVIRRKLLSGMDAKEIMKGLEKTVVAFTNKVINALQSAVVAAYSLQPAKAQAIVIDIVNPQSITDAVRSALEAPVSKISNAKIDNDPVH